MTRVGIFGAGGMGSVHARHYAKMPDVEVKFFDPDAKVAEDFSKRFGIECLASTEALLDWAEVADICLPTDLHATLALTAIKAGKALFIEKPLARTMDEARAIASAAREAKATVGVGHVVRYFREYRAAHDAVLRGDVGKVAAVRMRRGGAPPRGGVGWFMDHNRSGGVVVDLAIHEFDWIRWTLGPVTTVYARSVATEENKGADYALATLSLESGAVAHVEGTWMDPSGFRATFEVCGSQGMLQYDSREAASLKTAKAGNQAMESPLAAVDDPFYNQLRAFVDAVQGKVAPPVGIEEGAAALAIALAARESALTGLPVRPESL
ncbi:MAG: Gfo/Idh/MocA family oxidoreductase [Fimbriimonadales bacterium]